MRKLCLFLPVTLVLLTLACGGGGSDGKKHTFKAKLDTTKFEVVDTSTMGRLLRVVLPERAYADDPALEDVTKIWAIPLRRDPDPIYGIAMSLKNIQDRKEVTIDSQGNFMLDISAMAQIADSMLLVLVDENADRSERFKGIVGIKSVNDESLVQIPLERVSGSIDAGLVTESTVEEHVAETEADTGDVAPSLGVPASLLDEQAQMDNATKSVRTLIANYEGKYRVEFTYEWTSGLGGNNPPTSIAILIRAPIGTMGTFPVPNLSDWIMPTGNAVKGGDFAHNYGAYDDTGIDSRVHDLQLSYLNHTNYGQLLNNGNVLCYFDVGYTGLFTSQNKPKVIPYKMIHEPGKFIAIFRIDRDGDGTYEPLTENEFNSLDQYIGTLMISPYYAWSDNPDDQLLSREVINIGDGDEWAFSGESLHLAAGYTLSVEMKQVGRTSTTMTWNGIVTEPL